MEKAPKIFLSNQVEQLYVKLRETLFEGTHPFSKRIIIVPSPAMKSWLSVRMAEDPMLRVCMGVEIVYLEEGLDSIFRLTSINTVKMHLPSNFELSIKIETELKKIISNFNILQKIEQQLWKPLIEYLKIEKGTMLKKSEYRLVALSEKLAHLFNQYGCYAGKMIDSWENNKSQEWQAELWKIIFCDPSQSWTTLYHQYRSYIAEKPQREVHLHFFAISFLSSLQLQFLEKVLEVIPINHYFLSPCALFWSDVCSDKQRIFLKHYWQNKDISKEEEKCLEELLRDRNPLLANFGRLGRETAKEIEESLSTPEEFYLVSEHAVTSPFYANAYFDDYICNSISYTKSLTMLEAIQTDMLLLRNPSDEKKLNFDADKSIQVHIAPNKLREVEILYDNLVRIISEHTNDENPITPSDIIVLTPEILEYEPYIKAIFDGSNSLLNCQIMDLKIPAQSQLIQAFLHLLALPQSRWDTKMILQLFEYRSFQKKHNFSFEDIQTIRSWIRETGILWGENSDHRDEILNREHCRFGMVDKRSFGTWEYGLNLLIKSLMSTSETVNLDFSRGELLGKFIEILRSLHMDLTPLINGVVMTTLDWSEYLTCLLNGYFFYDTKEEGLQEESTILLKKIEQISQIKGKIALEKFCFYSIKNRLETSLYEQHICYRENHLQSVKFCSMLPMRAIPSRVVVLIGLVDGAYPKQDLYLSLNALQDRTDVDYCPKQVDYDRYLFLEILLSARQYLILSYSEHSSKDGQKQMPSLLISELLNYLDETYRVKDKLPSEQCVVNHPYHSFDHKYFETESLFKTYITDNYFASAAYYQTQKKKNFCFIETFSIKNNPDSSMLDGLHLTIRDLVNTVKNPLKLYFNESLGIYFKQDSDEEIRVEENFSLSHLESYKIKKMSIKMPFEKAIEQADRQGKLPIGLFGEVAKIKISKDSTILAENLKNQGISSEEIFEIQLTEECETPSYAELGVLSLPAIEIDLNGNKIKITGTINDVCRKGLLVYSDDKSEELIKFWAESILVFYLIKKHSLIIEPQIILLKSKSGKTKIGNFENLEELLKSLVYLCILSKQNASPLIPNWLKEVTSKDQHELEKQIEVTLNNDFNPIYNDYIQWILPEDKHLDAKNIIEEWRGIAQKTYAAYYQAWFNQLEDCHEEL